jgi:hypothetical protein
VKTCTFATIVRLGGGIYSTPRPAASLAHAQEIVAALKAAGEFAKIVTVDEHGKIKDLKDG